MENELSASRILNAYLSLHLPFSVHESAQTAICYARVFLSSNFSCSFVNLLRLLALLGHVTGSNLFFLRSLLFHAGQAKDGGVTRRQIARQKKGKKKKRKDREQRRKGTGEEIHRSTRRLIRARIVYPRLLDITSTRCSRRSCFLFPFSWLHVPCFLHSYRSSFLFSLYPRTDTNGPEEARMWDSQRMPRKDCSPFSWMQSLKSKRGKMARLKESPTFFV